MTRFHYLRLQKTFFTRLNCSCADSVVKITHPKATVINTFTDFTGDNKRSDETTYELPCLYQRNISDKERSKYGISNDVSARIYVSPLSLEKVTGYKIFTPEIRKVKGRIQCEIFDEKFMVDQIIDLEPLPMTEGGTLVLAYELRLKKRT